eukprot:Skav207498  [mRNA]  locus=scaffold334:136028:138104:- [translate_table: standard]
MASSWFHVPPCSVGLNCAWAAIAMWRLLFVAAVAADEVNLALEAFDDCQDETSSCALNALQLRKRNYTANDTDDLPDLGGHGWWPGGDKLWGSGKGLEDIDEDNVDYYNAGRQR